MKIKSILLIDDDEDDQEIFISALDKINSKISCTAISQATEALLQLKSKRCQPDLIFLDLNMPLMNGIQFLTQLKKEKDLLPIAVIIFSTTSSPATVAQARELGAHDFITKPDRYDDLVHMLSTIFS